MTEVDEIVKQNTVRTLIKQLNKIVVRTLIKLLNRKVMTLTK